MFSFWKDALLSRVDCALFFRQSIRRQGHKVRKSKKGKDLSLLERCYITFLTSRVKRSRYHKYPKVCFSSRQSKHLGTRTLPDVVSAESYSKHPTTRVTSSRKLTWAENQGWSWLGGVSWRSRISKELKLFKWIEESGYCNLSFLKNGYV